MQHIPNDPLSEPELRRQLDAIGCAVPDLRCLEVVDSTNSTLKRAAREGAPHGTVAIADGQTAGRGRLGRSFQSPRGKGIYLSVLLRPGLPAERLLPAAPLAALALCDAIEGACGLRPRIKWTNDLVLNNKKIAGILTELDGGALIIGAGVNVSQGPEDFSPDVAAMASSLSRELGRPVPRTPLAARLTAALLGLDLAGDLTPYLDAYRRDCLTLGGRIRLLRDGQKTDATAEDIDDAFGLVVRLDDGRRLTVRSGEVSVRGLYGYID